MGSGTHTSTFRGVDSRGLAQGFFLFIELACFVFLLAEL